MPCSFTTFSCHKTISSFFIPSQGTAVRPVNTAQCACSQVRVATEDCWASTFPERHLQAPTMSVRISAPWPGALNALGFMQ